MTRNELIDVLAQVSHDVYERHYTEAGRPPEDMIRGVNEHDRQRAEASVERLEAVGMLRPHSA